MPPILRYGLPKNLLDWAEAHRQRLAPPVCNAALFPDGDYIVNVVGGPNTRTDFHDNPTEEIFYQLQGNAYLHLWERGRFERVDLKAGDVFLMPAHVQHSPQRPEAGLCLLVERRRPAGQPDSFHWYCAHCAALVWSASQQLASLVDDLPVIFRRFQALDAAERVCPQCGTQHPGADYASWHAQLRAAPAPA